MGTDFSTLPSINTVRTRIPRNIHWGGGNNVTIRDPAVLTSVLSSTSRDTGSPSNTGLIRPGCILGKITTGGKCRVGILGLNTVAVASGDSTVTCNGVVGTEVARIIAANGATALKLVGPPTAAGTVATVSATANSSTSTVITLSATAGTALAAGSLICIGDGSHTPVEVFDPSSDGMGMVLNSGTAIDQAMPWHLKVASLVAANLINFVADDFGTAVDTSVTAWIKAAFVTAGRLYSYDTQY